MRRLRTMHMIKRLLRETSALVVLSITICLGLFLYMMIAYLINHHEKSSTMLFDNPVPLSSDIQHDTDEIHSIDGDSYSDSDYDDNGVGELE